MTRIVTTILIRCPIEQVFEYVTTPDNWPKWHPSSRGVSGAVDHSLLPGEQVAEEFRVAGRQGRTVWTVRARQPPTSWTIDSDGTGRGRATIGYTLSDQADGTLFQRELVYVLFSPLVALLDWLVLRRRVQAESQEALRRLKAVLEADS